MKLYPDDMIYIARRFFFAEENYMVALIEVDYQKMGFEELVWHAAYEENENAQFELGNRYHKGINEASQDDGEAVRWWRKAARQGHAAAENSLGIALCIGWDGIEPNPQRGMKFIRAAARKGYASAQYNLGRAYFIGEKTGVKQDFRKAREWVEKAVAQNYKHAKRLLKKITAFHDNAGKSKKSPQLPGHWISVSQQDKCIAG